ncbi:molybdate ABC transporter substrate-binding protein [Rathayibacter sp. YIM 133350]|uniref:molybdate ABC transporter substrate-binding protein n=1 Tax=Rathayibacter sp. YIM 133350 TaxID=3131992 RepID=UPI00307DAB75
MTFRRRRALTTALIAAATLALALTGCAPTGAASPAPSPPPPSASGTAALRGQLTVYAAASLQNAFENLLAQFADENPDVRVHPAVYDGSSVLATQIIEGAPADVFASADEKTLAAVAKAGEVSGSAHPFATNTLRLITPPGNPAGISSLGDLARSDVSVVLCAPAVPCGAASATLLEKAGVEATPASQEQNVTAVLTKVEQGEADAGLVYATDARAAGNAVHAIEPQGAAEVVNTYPIAELRGAASPDVARAFVDFVRGDRGRAVLAAAGFGAP